MSKRPQDTSAEEPNGGNLHVRLGRGPGRGNRPGLLNKKARSSRSGELRREYKRSDFPGGFVRGKYAARFAAGSNIVGLDPEIADAFPTSAAVNEALGTVLRAAKAARLTKRR